MRIGRLLTINAVVAILASITAGCHSVDDDRIPSLPVNISLADQGTWNTYGVAGFGSSRNFILSGNEGREPLGFPYTQTSATGFGGVLLISGMDPYTMTADMPLAYDLACPVEMKRTVRVYVEGDMYEAVCPECGSHYDVTMGGGTPLSGPAAAGDTKHGLRRYRCLPTANGGYIITN